MKKSYFEIGTTGEKKRYKTRLIIQTSAQFLVERFKTIITKLNLSYESLLIELLRIPTLDIADIIGEDFYNFYFEMISVPVGQNHDFYNSKCFSSAQNFVSGIP